MIASPPPAYASLAVGEVYSCTSVHAGRQLQATIGRIDTMPNGAVVVSVSVIDKDPASTLPFIGHMPFFGEAFITSCPTLLAVKTSVPDGFNEGYQTWRDDKGGYFTTSVDQAIDFATSAMRQPPIEGGQKS